MPGKLIRGIFWAMVAFFIIIILTMFVGIPLAGNQPIINIFLPAIAVYLILGVALLVLTVKRKVSGRFKKFLLLTGASAVALPVFAVLHNLVTALCINFFGFDSDFDEPVFFILGTTVCPIGFLVGAVGTIILGFKNKPGLNQAIEGGKP